MAPENSLKSFKLLLDYKISGVELDIHITKDNRLVVIHDFNTYKMTGKNHVIAETEYKLLKTLDIGEGEKIPLLEDVFMLLGDNVHYDLEIKNKGEKREILVEKLYILIKKYKIERKCFVSSFNPQIINTFKRLKSGISTGIIYSRDKENPFFLRHGLGILLTNSPIIKPQIGQLKGFLFIFFTRILKKKVYTWTVNSLEQYHLAVKKGCRGICTDFPQNFI